jgi:transposase, IS5 family
LVYRNSRGASDEHGREIEPMTIANMREHRVLGPCACRPDLYGDSAFAGARPEGIIRARGGTPCIVHTSTWSGPDVLARLEAHNAEVRRIRAWIEKVFGTAKRCYGLRGLRWLGLAKAGLQVRLAAMAYNLRRSWRLLAGEPA